MKPFKIIFLLSPILIIGACSAQSFTVIKATRQVWSGGVVGHHGINYYIELETASKTIKPDTAWINGKVYPLKFSDKQGGYIRSVDSVTHKINYTITVGESYQDFRRPPTMPEDTATEKPKPVRQFNGAAMISYMLKHKQHFFIVKNFAQLKVLNYP